MLFEEGELAGWAYRTLLPHAGSVEACDPKLNAWIARGSRKSDPVDARKLAELRMLGSYSPVYHPAEDGLANLKIAVQHYDQVTRGVTRLKNQIKARLRQQGVIVTGSKAYGLKGREEAIAKVPSEAIGEIVRQDFRMLDEYLKERARAYSLVSRLSKGYEGTGSLKEVPGVGVISAARFVAYVGTPHRFDKRGIWQFSRLGVVKRESDGSPLGREHLDRAGSGAMKALSRTVFNGAMATRGPNGIRRFYESSLRRTGNETHARLNTQRKILALMLALWRDGTRYSDDLVTGGA